MMTDPIVNLPSHKTDIVIHVDDYLADGTDDYTAIQDALKACRQQQAAELVFARRVYRISPNYDIPHGQGHIHLLALQDLTIDGNGAEFLCHQITPGITIRDCQRLVLKNFVLDWDFQLASAGIVEIQNDGRTAVRTLDDYPLQPETERVTAVSEYDHAGFNWEMNGQELYYPKDVELIAPQLFYSPSFEEERKPPHGSGKLANGTQLVVRHYVYDAEGININHSRNADITLENIIIYQAPGHAFACFSSARGFRLKNNIIARKPGSNNLISATADGAHFAFNEGDIIIENCDFSHQGDDSVNIHGNWMILTEDAKDGEMKFTTRLFNRDNVRFEPGDLVRFCRDKTLERLGEATVTSVTADYAAGVGTLQVEPSPNFELKAGDCFGNLSRSCSNFIIRNNHFHDHRARGMLLQATNGLVKDNLIENVMGGAFFFTSDCNYWKEGYGCENLIIRRNTMRGCNKATWERGPGGRHMACLNLLVDTQDGLSPAHLHRNITIEENTIEDTPGLAILISSAQDIRLSNNTVINANNEPFGRTGEDIDAKAHGAIMVTRSDHVELIGNEVIAGPHLSEEPIYIDTRNTTNVSFDKKTVERTAAKVSPTLSGINCG